MAKQTEGLKITVEQKEWFEDEQTALGRSTKKKATQVTMFDRLRSIYIEAGAELANRSAGSAAVSPAPGGLATKKRRAGNG